MSGGSYEYLCYKDAGDFFNSSASEQMERMAERLAGLKYADDAAQETLALLLRIRQTGIYWNTIAQRLHGVWKAVEWTDSGDYGPGDIEESLVEYRKQGETP